VSAEGSQRGDEAAAALAKRLRVKDAILDGEIICADKTGRPFFIEMPRGRHPVCFCGRAVAAQLEAVLAVPC
jgi:hypothetical protein